jgi:hypothetical protein
MSRAEPVRSDAAVYTIADRGFFPGVVALVNSLRLGGFDRPIVILDCGFTPAQREILAPHCRLIEVPPRRAINPTQYKPFAHLLRPDGIVIVIDSDIIVTRSLEAMISLAREGRICAFADPERHRWFPEWQQLFDLQAPLRHEVYVNAGFLAWSTAHWPTLLARWWQCCERTYAHRTIREGASNAGPLAQADQDALNALLMSEIPSEAMALQPKEEEVFRWDLRRVSVVEPATLSCRYLGHRVTLLHNNGGGKLWDRAAWRRVTRENAYLRLLRRLLTGTDIAIRIPEQTLPLWLRAPAAARAATALLYGCNRLISLLLLPKGLVQRLRG